MDSNFTLLSTFFFNEVEFLTGVFVLKEMIAVTHGYRVETYNGVIDYAWD